MPANLPPAYFEAEELYRAAQTPEEKIKALRQMLSIMPKHKGTDKLHADLRRRLSQQQKELRREKKAGPRRFSGYHISKEGAGQIAVVGPPNSGKSRLIDKLTAAHPEVAPYPYTTRKPLPAMMPFEDIQIQLVDTPPISSEYLETWLPGIIRLADRVLLVADCQSESASDDVDDLITRLKEVRVHLFSASHPGNDLCDGGVAYKRTILVGNKVEGVEEQELFQVLEDLYGDEYGPLVAISAETGANIEALRQRLYDSLEVLRVYTKMPGKEPDMDRPFVLRKGSSVLDFARMIHKDFAENLKSARIWASDGKYDGQCVQRDYLVQDREVLELHM